jgi:hypothetical protein
MHIRAPRLYRNHHGTFYFRFETGQYERRLSLGKKDPGAASINRPSTQHEH